jgi:hypothetical protein
MPRSWSSSRHRSTQPLSSANSRAKRHHCPSAQVRIGIAAPTSILISDNPLHPVHHVHPVARRCRQDEMNGVCHSQAVALRASASVAKSDNGFFARRVPTNRQPGTQCAPGTNSPSAAKLTSARHCSRGMFHTVRRPAARGKVFPDDPMDRVARVPVDTCRCSAGAQTSILSRGAGAVTLATGCPRCRRGPGRRAGRTG